MNAPHSTAPPPRTAPLALWRVAEAFLHLLYNLFGAPEDVAAQHTLTAAAHKLLASWLRAGEAMLRRLLVIEASAYSKPNTRPILWPARQRVRRAIGFDAEHPEAWRVSFRCCLGPPASRRQKAEAAADKPARTPAVQVRRFHSAWPLAERYEALLRVFNDPAPFARRLARQLHATPHRLSPMLRAPPEAAGQIGPESFAQLGDAAEATRPLFNSS